MFCFGSKTTTHPNAKHGIKLVSCTSHEIACFYAAVSFVFDFFKQRKSKCNFSTGTTSADVLYIKKWQVFFYGSQSKVNTYASKCFYFEYMLKVQTSWMWGACTCIQMELNELFNFCILNLMNKSNSTWDL